VDPVAYAQSEHAERIRGAGDTQRRRLATTKATTHPMRSAERRVQSRGTRCHLGHGSRNGSRSRLACASARSAGSREVACTARHSMGSRLSVARPPAVACAARHSMRPRLSVARVAYQFYLTSTALALAAVFMYPTSTSAAIAAARPSKAFGV